MSEETATVPSAPEPAPAATVAEEPKPEIKAEPDWKAAYQGIQRTLNKRDERIEALVGQLASRTAPLESGMDTLLQQQLGEDGYKAHQEKQRIQTERQQALAAAQAAQQFIPQSIGVIAQTMRLAGVPEGDIQEVFAAARDTVNAEDWASTVGAGAKAALDKARAQETTKAQAQAKARSQEEIAVEANALAERTLRARGIDKVDLGKGQSSSDRGFVSKVKAIDRSTPEGEAVFQQMMKDAKRGTMQVS